MPTFAASTVHGLSADVYFYGTVFSGAIRTLGAITVAVEPEVLELTANDEGAFNPVEVLRRGESVTIGVPITDTASLAALSGYIFPFASTVSGASGFEVLLPKSVPGDSYLDKGGELRLVLRDGTATWVFPKAAVVGMDELEMSEEDQMVWGLTFRAFNQTVSGVETPFRIFSGAVITGP